MEWSGVEWSGVEWSGVEWSGVEWSGTAKRDGLHFIPMIWAGTLKEKKTLSKGKNSFL